MTNYTFDKDSPLLRRMQDNIRQQISSRGGPDVEEGSTTSAATGIVERPATAATPSVTDTDEGRDEVAESVLNDVATNMVNASSDPEQLMTKVFGDPRMSNTPVGDLANMETLKPLDEVLSMPSQTELAFGASSTQEPTSSIEESSVDASIAYPSNVDNTITFAQRVYPDDPQRAAALAATIQVEGMGKPVESMAYRYGTISQGLLYNENASGLMGLRRDVMLRELGQPVMKDEDGNILYRTVSQSQINMRAQEALKEAGLYDMAIDGQFGAGSQAALKQFQEQNNLEPTGILDSQTMEALGVDNLARDHEGNPVERRESLPSSMERQMLPEDARNKLFDIWYMDYYREPHLRLGNPSDGEAHRYIGRGPIQITGREAYQRLGEAIGVDLVNNPELLEDPEIALQAVEAFIDMKGFGEGEDPTEWIRSINPGMSQEKLRDRMRVFNETLNRVTNQPQTQVTESLVPRPRPNR